MNFVLCDVAGTAQALAWVFALLCGNPPADRPEGPRKVNRSAMAPQCMYPPDALSEHPSDMR